MAESAPSLLSSFSTSADFPQTALRCIRPAAKDAIDNVVVYCPAETIINLKDRDQILFEPSAQGMTQPTDHCMWESY
ncbi:hypothetical protein D3C72_1924350 [compost metagenome]